MKHFLTAFVATVVVTIFSQKVYAKEFIEDSIIKANISFQGYNETTPIFGQLQYRIFFHTTGGNYSATFAKPIIVSDGFDPGDTRKIQQSDYPIGSYDPKNGSKSIEDMMSYWDCNHDSINLIHQLTALGYDVIIVNYATYTASNGQVIDGGADYIERNAYNMIALIQSINGRLQTQNNTNQLAIVGPSMGGQITRYALAYMEKKYAETGDAQWKHNTRLWISIDSPHLGANIPLGAQSLVWLLSSQSPAADSSFKYRLNSPAARQQLIEGFSPDYDMSPNPSYLNGRTVSQGYSTNGGSSFFQQFYNNQFNNGLQNSKGYPMNLRKIALVNGSLSGKQSAVFNTSTGVLPINNGTLFGTYGYAGDIALNLRGFLGTFSTLVLATEAYNMPAYNSANKISRFKWDKITSGSDITLSVTNLNNRGSMDIVPGGWYNSWDQVNGSISGIKQSGLPGWLSFTGIFGGSLYLFFGGGVSIDQRTNYMVHSFIPSFSALGIKSPNQDWSQPLNTRNLACTKEIPFDSYFGHDDNTQHTSFDCESVNWLLKELADSAQDPWYPVSANSLVGSPNVCVNSTATYLFPTCLAPGNVSNWSTSSNLQIVSSFATNIIVKGLNNGNGTITATFTNGNKVTKTITVGVPTITTSQIGTASSGMQVNYYCSNQLDSWKNINLLPNIGSYGVTYYHLQVTGGGYFNNNLTTLDIYSNNDVNSHPPIYVPKSGNVVVTVTGNNSCGAASASPYVIVFTTMPCSSYVLSSSPNPATSTLNVTVTNVDSSSSINSLSASTTTSSSETSSTQSLISNSAGLTNMYLYDFNTSQLVKKWNYKENTSGTYNLNVSGVKRGIYVLKMERDNISATTKIILQ